MSQSQKNVKTFCRFNMHPMVTFKLPKRTRLPGFVSYFVVFLATFSPIEMFNVGSVAFAQEKAESLLSRAIKNREISNVKEAVDEKDRKSTRLNSSHG